MGRYLNTFAFSDDGTEITDNKKELNTYFPLQGNGKLSFMLSAMVSPSVNDLIRGLKFNPKHTCGELGVDGLEYLRLQSELDFCQHGYGDSVEDIQGPEVYNEVCMRRIDYYTQITEWFYWVDIQAFRDIGFDTELTLCDQMGFYSKPRTFRKHLGKAFERMKTLVENPKAKRLFFYWD